jgi:hypothetical protein
MARAKKESQVIGQAQQRLIALSSIDPALDLGNGLTITACQAEIDAVRAKLDAYNVLLSEVDAAYNVFQAAEKDLRDLHERMLEAVGVKFGKDSNEYEKAGGVRKSERKPYTRQKPTS